MAEQERKKEELVAEQERRKSEMDFELQKLELQLEVKKMEFRKTVHSREFSSKPYAPKRSSLDNRFEKTNQAGSTSSFSRGDKLKTADRSKR
ncbi:hypothetical protein NPIL_484921 [Nephila pilipes]|uniref:Uncharacterized protein n=1 Tax=Nephila pilipes TaxID=299642 RepID=A0A8X6U5B0_NEPPI|nr:hypothetical protein NPIL_484921 [Nephila pilipes]